MFAVELLGVVRDIALYLDEKSRESLLVASVLGGYIELSLIAKSFGLERNDTSVSLIQERLELGRGGYGSTYNEGRYWSTSVLNRNRNKGSKVICDELQV